MHRREIGGSHLPHPLIQSPSYKKAELGGGVHEGLMIGDRPDLTVPPHPSPVHGMQRQLLDWVWGELEGENSLGC